MSVPADYTIVRAGILDILMTARGLSSITPPQYQQLLILCMQTNAWCVREELDSGLLEAITPPQYQQLLILCMQTNAWCVREELDSGLLEAIALANGNPLTKDVIDGLLDLATKERVEHATRLSAYASSLLSGFTKH